MPQAKYPPLQFSGSKQEGQVTFTENGETQTLDNYMPEADLVRAVNLALLLEKPLLVMGEPGCGKSLLAKAIAYDLYEQKLFSLYREWHIKSTSKAKEGLYEFDYLRRLRDANRPQTDGNRSQTDGKTADNIEDVDKYIRYGAMGDAFRLSVAYNERVVLLVDEIDKADIDFPNDLLNELDRMEFEIPEKNKVATGGPDGRDQTAPVLPAKIKAKFRPIVVITSNSEKELPDAFLRRCVFHNIKPLDEEKLKKIVAGRYYDGKSDDPLIGKALTLFLNLRDTAKKELLSLGKNVSTGEFIDWFSALKHYGDLAPEASGQTAQVREMIKQLEMLDKNDLKQIPFSNILLKNANSVIRFNEQ